MEPCNLKLEEKEEKGEFFLVNNLNYGRNLNTCNFINLKYMLWTKTQIDLSKKNEAGKSEIYLGFTSQNKMP